MKVLFQGEQENSAPLFLDASQIRRLTNLEPTVISITERFRPAREKVERFIEGVYAQTYGTQLIRHYPTLMSVHDATGDILGAVGFRAAAVEPLFLEQYLDVPIEEAMRRAGIANAERRFVVEIGSLASRGKGASIFLFIVLAAYLRQQGFEYASATATGVLRRTFGMLGFDVKELAHASRAQLADRTETWGSYYETDPRVIAGAISGCFAQLEKFVPAAQNTEFGRLVPRLHYRIAP